MALSAYRLPAAVVLLAMSASSLTAAPLSDTLDFALRLSRLDSDLSDKQQPSTATVKRIGITAYDTHQQSLQAGIVLGYAYVSSDQALTTGLEPQGYYLGPALRTVVTNSRQLTVTLTGTYLFQRVKDSNATQAVTLEWYQPQLELDAVWRVSPRIGLTAGGEYGRIDADEKLSGAVNQTITLRKRATLGGRAGLEFDLSEDGQVGILLHRALGDGVEIYFLQQF